IVESNGVVIRLGSLTGVALIVGEYQIVGLAGILRLYPSTFQDPPFLRQDAVISCPKRRKDAAIKGNWIGTGASFLPSLFLPRRKGASLLFSSLLFSSLLFSSSLLALKIRSPV
ncbi:MAG: hypothetical protein K5876_07830, partial [Ruminiclostridium sp.]|nr:hypothetical protein [Ruminiclostridium sp.]